jgi:GTP-binding protein Era
MAEADLLLWVVDAAGFLGPAERELAQHLARLERPLYLLLNKVDLVPKDRLLAKVVEYKDLAPFREIIPIGAKFGENLDALWKILERDAPSGSWGHDHETFTDQSERSLASEFIREKVLRKTREEVPHGVAVRLGRWIEAGADAYPSDMPEDGVLIETEILVEHARHRAILLGAEGSKIADIRRSAQRELKKLLQRPVRLAIHVKVEEDWRDRPDKLDKLGL